VSKSKNYNSIVFLTTLSVYLGLVLVASVPQVLAQPAATTKQFNVKDEIEAKDDLDKNPDGEAIKSFLEKDYEAALSSFVEDLRKLKQDGRYRASGTKPFQISAFRRFCSAENEIATSSFDPTDASDANAWIEDAFLDIHSSFTVANNWNFATTPTFIKLPEGVSEDDRCKVFGLDTEINRSNFTVRITFSRETAANAALLAGTLDKYFIRKAARPRNTLTKQIYWYTRASADKNQVMIVTRLPRGSIAPLLAYTAPKTAKN
jgi:hypothetical protein